MNTRGSGFFDFSYTTLTVGNLLVAILFFATPSKAQRICSLAVAVILMVDMIVILAVGKLRAEEGWVGIVSVVWAFLIAVWSIITDRVVAWGKREEEERLTGREETRRTLTEWLAVLVSTIVMIVLIVVVVLLSATLILRARDASLEAPGKKYFVDGDKYQVHLFCKGNVTKGSPTVFFEAGERNVELGLVPFAENALKNKTIERYCYWDRPGFAWSDNGPSPLSAGMAADALSEALARAGETGPWVLVGPGIGSVYSRIFAGRSGKEVTGLLLIDPLHEDLLHRVGSPGKGFLLWAYGIISPLGIDRLSGALFRGRNRNDRVYGRSAGQSGKFIKAKLQENLVANSLTKNELSTSRIVMNQKAKLVVVSSGIEMKRDSEWEKKQRDLTHLTEKLLSWDVVQKAPHEVWATKDGRDVLEKRLGQLVKA
jgi:pimeloyl-ACP methyl ester carboxylesterase